jgi:carboxyl-terminal processing protease
MEQLEKMKNAGMQKLILDLRDNGGGMLDDAVQIADEFLGGNKQIVTTKGFHVSEQIISARRPGLFEEGKLVILINEHSASASEVLAGALQDWNRATIIGRRSFGKGLVQEQFTLSDGSAIRLTVARYFTPIGRSIQKPYNKGADTSYQHEVSQRISDGEILNNNHNDHIGKPFKLQDGRILYSEEGISPDIFVPIDSIRWLLNSQSAANQKRMTEAALQYFRANGIALKKLKQVAELRPFLNKDQQIHDWLNVWCQSLPTGVNVYKCKEFYFSEFEDMLCWMIWNVDGYYRSSSIKDPAVQNALSVLKK